MDSGSKSLLLISANPKIARALPRGKNLKPNRAEAKARECASPLRFVAPLFRITEIEGGFPHSEIPGSKPVRGSPGLIAAYHVLHRLSAPRHPPDALKTLDRSHRQRAPSGSPAPPTESRLPQSVQAAPVRLGCLRIRLGQEDGLALDFRKDQFCFKRIREPKRSSQAHD